MQHSFLHCFYYRENNVTDLQMKELQEQLESESYFSVCIQTKVIRKIRKLCILQWLLIILN